MPRIITVVLKTDSDAPAEELFSPHPGLVEVVSIEEKTENDTPDD
jgi:hypothetical protein